ncbi:ran-interacting Mog1 protein [Diplocarpon rosae]|nr:ran-interacting Mog1 protein [Diplocarpon rosae]
MTTYTSTPLFGGALIVDLPSNFADVSANRGSTIRQVPDHQEVYLDKDGFTSIIFDITERLMPPSEHTPAYTLIATQTPPPQPGSTSPDFTAIVLTLIRLEQESTDILVTINVPHIQGEYTVEEVDMQMGKQGRLIESAVEHAAKIWETFKIKDWGLFNEV